MKSPLQTGRRSHSIIHQATPSATTDSTVKISSSKAKELKLSNGDEVVLVGRRRRASYAKVAVQKLKSKKAAQMSPNLATNLRLRQDDTVKIVPLKHADEAEARSGDLVLLKVKAVPTATSVTFSPIQDSLDGLVASEGGDEISDEEITERFIKPYTEATGGFVKSNSVLTLMDENGKKLDFIVTHVDVGGGGEKEEAAKGTFDDPLQ